MSFLTPDPDRFPRPAERFQWRWNRILLLIQLAVLVIFLGVLGAQVAGVVPLVAAMAWLGSFSLLGAVAFLGGFVLPAASCLAGRIRDGPDGVTGMLVGGAVGMGLLMALLGVDQLLQGGDLLPSLLAGALVVSGGVAVLGAVVGGVAARGRWPGFGAAILGAGFVSTGVLIPGPHDGPHDAYLGAVRSDLRNVMAAQKIHRGASGGYASALDELSLSASTGVILSLERTADGWIARGSHTDLDVECAVYVGSTPARRAEREGELACLQDRRFYDLSRRRDRTGTMGAILGAFFIVSLIAVESVREQRDSGGPSPPLADRRRPDGRSASPGARP